MVVGLLEVCESGQNSNKAKAENKKDEWFSKSTPYLHLRTLTDKLGSIRPET